MILLCRILKICTIILAYVYRSNDPTEEILPPKPAETVGLIPLELQAGHNLPDGSPANR